MNEQNKRTLEIKLILVSDNTFDVEIHEPETGEFQLIKCHDNGNSIEAENKQITDEIRSWVNIMREEAEEDEE